MKRARSLLHTASRRVGRKLRVHRQLEILRTASEHATLRDLKLGAAWLLFCVGAPHD
jgi:hypothetical protein